MDLDLAGSPQDVNIIASMQIGHRSKMSKAIDLQLSPATSTLWIRETPKRNTVCEWNNTEQWNTLSGQIHADTFSTHTRQKQRVIQALISHSIQSNDLACSGGSSSIAEVQALVQALVLYSSLPPAWVLVIPERPMPSSTERG